MAGQLLLNIEPKNYNILINIRHYLLPLQIEQKIIIKDLQKEHYRPMNTSLVVFNDNIIAFIRWLIMKLMKEITILEQMIIAILVSLSLWKYPQGEN